MEITAKRNDLLKLTSIIYNALEISILLFLVLTLFVATKILPSLLELSSLAGHLPGHALHWFHPQS